MQDRPLAILLAHLSLAALAEEPSPLLLLPPPPLLLLLLWLCPCDGA